MEKAIPVGSWCDRRHGRGVRVDVISDDRRAGECRAPPRFIEGPLPRMNPVLPESPLGDDNDVEPDGCSAPQHGGGGRKAR